MKYAGPLFVMLLMVSIMNPAGAAELTTVTLQPLKQDVMVYAAEGKFCGWPANEGVWNWGDEILVGFEVGDHVATDRGHSIDRASGPETKLARSLDGGETWQLETHAFPRPGEIHKPGSGEDEAVTQAVALPEPVAFDHPDFAMKLRGRVFYTSTNRGADWQGPWQIPDLGLPPLMARTDYIVTGDDTALVGLTAAREDGQEGRPFSARVSEGGQRWEFLSWIAPDLPVDQGRPSFSIMPSTVELQPGVYLTAIRQRLKADTWTDVFRSDDGGTSWTHQSTPQRGGRTPASMVRLDDGRIVITYGRRFEPFGIRARISADEGRSWGPEIVLRDDGANWDIGYPRTVVRPDGRLVTIYYFSTAERPQQHIAATLWDPDELTPVPDAGAGGD